MHPLTLLPLLLAPLANAQQQTQAAATTVEIYTAPGSGYKYHGCYNETTELPDTLGVRALNGGTNEVRPGNMTVDMCIAFCGTGAGDASGGKTGKFAFVGLEYARYVLRIVSCFGGLSVCLGWRLCCGFRGGGGDIHTGTDQRRCMQRMLVRPVALEPVREARRLGVQPALRGQHHTGLRRQPEVDGMYSNVTRHHDRVLNGPLLNWSPGVHGWCCSQPRRMGCWPGRRWRHVVDPALMELVDG